MKPVYQDGRVEIWHGDARVVLQGLPAASVHCVVTSPPFWGLRNYGTEPQVWGGEPACAHEWGEELSVRAAKGNLGNKSGLEGTQTADLSKSAANLGAFCSCGAWRGSLGLEPTPDLYVEHLVEVFREVRRVLREDGTCWLNLGDCYATGAGRVGDHPGGGEQGARWKGESAPSRGYRGDRLVSTNSGIVTRPKTRGQHTQDNSGKAAPRLAAMGPMIQPNRLPVPGLKPKDLVGIPWRVAFALQADGWWLRQRIAWCKRAPMPESVQDRPTSAVEDIFLLAKSQRYFYDVEAVKEPLASSPKAYLRAGRSVRANHAFGSVAGTPLGASSFATLPSGRNMRNYWLLSPEPYVEAHFATFPSEIPRRAILAGTSARGCCRACGAPWERVTATCRSFESGSGRCDHIPGGKSDAALQDSGATLDVKLGLTRHMTTLGWRPTCCCRDQRNRVIPCIVLDPFAGSGTTLYVAKELGRRAVGVELNADYLRLAEERLRQDVLPLAPGIRLRRVEVVDAPVLEAPPEPEPIQGGLGFGEKRP